MTEVKWWSALGLATQPLAWCSPLPSPNPVSRSALLSGGSTVEASGLGLDLGAHGHCYRRSLWRPLRRSTPLRQDQPLDTDTLIGDEDPMPQAIKDAISVSYPDVTWVDLSGANAILVAEVTGRFS